MTDIAFYHLTRSALDQALPLLLEKTLEAGKRALVRAGSAQQVDALNNSLWTYGPESWLPHGSAENGSGEDQPIWLTREDDAPNQAEFLFLADGVECPDLGKYERCFELFDGTSDDAVKVAREHWKAYKDQGHSLTYWQQTETGGWQKKET